MAVIGDLFVKLGLDTSDFAKGVSTTLNQFTSEIKSASNEMSNAFGKAGNDASANFNKGLDGINAGLTATVRSAQLSAAQISSALSKMIPPGGILPPKTNMNGFFVDPGALIKSISQVTDYIINLQQMGVISSEVAMKMSGFARTLYSMGYGVDTIIEKIQQIVYMFTRATTASQATSNGFNQLRNSVLMLTAGFERLASAGRKGSMFSEVGRGVNSMIPLLTAGTNATAAFASGTFKNTRNLQWAWNKFFTGFKSAAGSFASSINNLANTQNNFTNKATKNLKDVTRIAQGIIVSQAFYRSVNAIETATGALTTFAMETEQARTSFALLLRDGDKAERFTQMLEDFAARTPFTFQQATDNARKLLAYGFKAESMKPLMGTLADASAVSGNAETFDRVGIALGQIRTKGRLAAQELLQLTEAGIPAFDILQEKLHLTDKQLANIGKQGISAETAITAILAGMQERYGGAAAAMSNTVKGMLDTLKDNAKIIGATAFEPLYYGFKSVLTRMRDLTDSWRNSLRSGGIGQLLRDIIPPEIFPKIQLLAANLILFKQNLGLVWQAIMPVVRAIGEFLLNAFNLIMPIINAVTRVLAVLAGWVSSCTGFIRGLVGAIGGLLIAAWVTNILINFGAVIRSLFIVKAVAQLIIWLAQAIRFLSLAMMSNPWIAALGIATGALLYFGMTSAKVSGWINQLGSSISALFGVDPSKLFAPKMKKNTEVASEFNQKLDVSKDKLDGMGDSAEKAGDKAKKSLMAFDEVFNLEDPTDETNAGADETFDISPEIPPVTIPDPIFPDTGTLVQQWVDQFKTDLLERLKAALTGAAIGAVIGGVIGGLLGGAGGAQIGAGIGALAGGIAGYFWDQMPIEIKNSIKAAGIGTAIGGVIGAIIGGPFGAGIGAIIGGAIGTFVGYFWDAMSTEMQNSIKGVGIGAAVGGVIGAFLGPGGILAGAAIGAAIGAFGGYFWDLIYAALKEPVSNFISEIEPLWTDVIQHFKDAFTGDTWLEIGKNIILGIIEGWNALSTTIGSAIYNFVFKPIWDGIKSLFGIASPAKEMVPLGEYIIQGLLNGLANISPWNTIVNIKNAIVDAWEGFSLWQTGKDIITNFWNGLNNLSWPTRIMEIRTDIVNGWNGFSIWSIGKAIITKFWDGLNNLSWPARILDLRNKIWNGWNGFSLWQRGKDIISNFWNGINALNWWNLVKSLREKIVAGWNGFSLWTKGKDIIGTFRSGLDSLWWPSRIKDIWTKVKNAWSNYSLWTRGKEIIGSFRSGLDSLWWPSRIKDIWTKVKNAWSGYSLWSVGNSLATSFKNGLKNITSTSSGLFWDIKTTAVGAVNKIIDAMNSMINKINDYLTFEIPWWVPYYGGESWSMDIPTIPHVGHAAGGVFDKEHIANFAEGNKMEAILPVENPGAMAQVRNAIFDGDPKQLIAQAVQAGMGVGGATRTSEESLRPILYVGTLVANDQGLRELKRKMDVISLQETRRRG